MEPYKEIILNKLEKNVEIIKEKVPSALKIGIDIDEDSSETISKYAKNLENDHDFLNAAIRSMVHIEIVKQMNPENCEKCVKILKGFIRGCNGDTLILTSDIDFCEVVKQIIEQEKPNFKAAAQMIISLVNNKIFEVKQPHIKNRIYLILHNYQLLKPKIIFNIVEIYLNYLKNQLIIDEQDTEMYFFLFDLFINLTIEFKNEDTGIKIMKQLIKINGLDIKNFLSEHIVNLLDYLFNEEYMEDYFLHLLDFVVGVIYIYDFNELVDLSDFDTKVTERMTNNEASIITITHSIITLNVKSFNINSIENNAKVILDHFLEEIDNATLNTKSMFIEFLFWMDDNFGIDIILKCLEERKIDVSTFMTILSDICVYKKGLQREALMIVIELLINQTEKPSTYLDSLSKEEVHNMIDICMEEEDEIIEEMADIILKYINVE